MTFPTVPLSEVAEINPVVGSGISETEVAFLPMAGVSSEDSIVTPSETRSLSDVSNGFTYFQSGDVLVAKITPCFENGKIAQVQMASLHGFGSTEFHVVRASGDRLDSRYLVHFLRQPRVRAAGERRMTGSAGQRRVPKQFISDLRIPLPAVEEQRQIAAILDKSEDLRAKRVASKIRIDWIPRAVFMSLFGDPIRNNHNWPVKQFGEVGTLDRGVSQHRPRNAPELLNGPYPFIQTGDIATCDGYIRGYRSTYSEAGLSQSRLWPKGTLCITIAANIAKTGILGFDACFPDSVVGFIPFDLVTTEYIQTWMSFLQATLERIAPESAQKNINLNILRNLPIPVPPVNLQREFTRVMHSVENLRSTSRDSLHKLGLLFGSLQSRAFRGEL